MKYISLFAGIGGFDLALNRLGHECVYVNEWDKYAAQTYEKNFKHKVDTTSITDVAAGTIPRHDLLVGGFPCQAFSIAGKRRGFDETRGTLFFDIARILKHHQTKYFILENVKGLLSHDGGRTFRVIIKTITELGYDCQWQVLNSKNFGVPQNRERVFIVGNRRDVRRPNVFPITNNSNGVLDFIGGIGEPNRLKDGKQLSRNYKQGYRVYSDKGIANTLPSQTVGGLGGATGLYMVQCENGQLTINEKVYQMSESVSSYARELLLGLSQSERQELSSTQMQDLFSRIRQGLQTEECFDIEREPQEIRQQPEGNIQEVETLGAFLGGADGTGGVCGVVSIPTEEMLLLWDNGGDAYQGFMPIQQQDSQADNRQSRYEETLRSWKHSPLLFAVQPHQGRLFYSIGDGRDWIKVYQTKVEVICKENTLSSILEDNPDPKYFLSQKATEGIMRHKENHKAKGNGFGATIFQVPSIHDSEAQQGVNN